MYADSRPVCACGQLVCQLSLFMLWSSAVEIVMAVTVRLARLSSDYSKFC